MNPLVLAILSKNRADLEAIVSTIGIQALFQLMPHILNILQTLEDAQKKP